MLKHEKRMVCIYRIVIYLIISLQTSSNLIYLRESIQLSTNNGGVKSD